MKTSKRLLLLSVLSALPGAAAAADGAAVDTSQWKCESCKFEQGTTGSVTMGAGAVSDNSAKFGDYTGLNRKGAYFIGDGDARYRGADGKYWNLNATNLGLDARSVDAEGGQQGKYKLQLKYDQIPHYLTNSSQTPFDGNRGASLTLPAGYPAATTGLMPLVGSLQSVDLGTERKTLGVGGSWTRTSEWEYAVNFRHETRDGTKRTAGAFFVNTANLAEPVRYETDQLDASASYTGKRLQMKFAYYGSMFRNENDSLTWKNPFSIPAFPGANIGQLALAPDNQYHQLQASSGFQFNERTRGTADIAAGRMTQNENFLASTMNAGLGAGPLPSTTLNGRADTLNANLKLTSAVTNKIRLNAAYSHNDRESHTPQAAYPSVTTDMFLGLPTTRTNMPYTFKQDKLKFSAEYKATAKTRAAIGYDNDTQQRNFQSIAKNREETVWGKATTGIMDKADLSLKLAHAERRNFGYIAAIGVTPLENPLMRKYNMASRTRETVGVRADVSPRENVTMGVGIDNSKDTYTESTIGLRDGSSFNVNGDISIAFTPATSVHVFANREVIKSQQAGSQAFSYADWTANNKDTIDFFGLGVKHAMIKDKLDVGADYGLSRSRGEVNVLTGVWTPGFPNLATSMNTFKLSMTYRVKENLSVNAGYWYERYESKNWAQEGLAPSGVPNVIANFLAFGDPAPQYKVQVVRLSMKYKF
ncbi:MAG: MtrB/PioB family decaheme-associated outer membrane protein [Proteobacteria bacterium]|nr:MtrB/PioB family decaheme-associated outer membrane protein [Pseudomonadota bacterium]